ncbi:hypothetical protein BC829DRAFT_440091 [Chytridium lagenaria]|nr:hypothetical protein BC829DRAFT_440091 [Chytridium lagenaria]
MSPLRGRRRGPRKDDLSEDDSDHEQSFVASDSEKDEEDDENDSEEEEEEEDEEEGGEENGDVKEGAVSEESVPILSEVGEIDIGKGENVGTVSKPDTSSADIESTSAQVGRTKGTRDQQGDERRKQRPNTNKSRGHPNATGEEGVSRSGDRNDEKFWSKGVNSSRGQKGDAYWLHDDRNGFNKRGGFRGRGRGGAGYGRRGGYIGQGREGYAASSSQREEPSKLVEKSNGDEELVVDFKDIQSITKEWGTASGPTEEWGASPSLVEEWGASPAVDEWGSNPPSPSAEPGRIDPRQDDASDPAYPPRGAPQRGGLTRAASTRTGYGKRGYGKPAPTGLVEVNARGSRYGSSNSQAREPSSDGKWTHDKFKPEIEDPPELNRRRSWGGQRESRRPPRSNNDTMQKKRSSVSSFKQIIPETDQKNSHSPPSRASSVRRDSDAKVDVDSAADSPATTASQPNLSETADSPSAALKQPAPRRLAFGSGGALPLWRKAAGEAAAEAQIAAEAAKKQASLRGARKATVSKAETHDSVSQAPTKSKRYMGSKAVDETFLNEGSEEALKQSVNAPEFVPKSVLAEHTSLNSESSMTVVQEEEGNAEDGVTSYPSRKENISERRKNFRKERGLSGKSYNQNDQNYSNDARNFSGRELQSSGKEDMVANVGPDVSPFAQEFVPDGAPSGRYAPRPPRRGRGGYNSYQRGDRPPSQNSEQQQWAPMPQNTTDHNQEYMGPMMYEEYPQYMPNQDDGSIPIHPVMTHSGHVVLMTEGGLMVPTENFMYAISLRPFCSSAVLRTTPYIPSATLPVVYPLPADPSFASEMPPPQLMVVPPLLTSRGIEIKDPSSNKKVVLAERKEKPISEPSLAEAS